MNLADNRNLMLIDYEYAGWNPMAMDLANYISETILENAYPLGNGINWYLDNVMQQPELESMIKTYMVKYFDTYMQESIKQKYSNSSEEFLKQEYENLEE
jgi:thiamine kinase-like enzyme